MPRRFHTHGSMPWVTVICALLLATGAALVWPERTGTPDAAREPASAAAARHPAPQRPGVPTREWMLRTWSTDTMLTESEAIAALSALRAWARVEPEPALAWARQRTGKQRLAALIAAFEGAADQPGVALQLARDFMRDEPGLAADCGSALLGAWLRAGELDCALAFALSGPAELRSLWLSRLLVARAERDPGFAGTLAPLMAEHGIAGEPFEKIVHSWAKATPAQAADFALNLPPGPCRRAAVHATVSAWASQDPASLAAALPRFTVAAECDRVVATFVTHTDALHRPTATALAWAEAIHDPALRRAALLHVFGEWAAQDAAAAARHAATAPGYAPAERSMLLAALNRTVPLE